MKKKENSNGKEKEKSVLKEKVKKHLTFFLEYIKNFWSVLNNHLWE